MRKSYLEECIEHLPPEKREAAREAYKDLAETGDGGFLSKLLLILEANGAFAERIPATLSAALANGLSGLDSRLTRWTEGLCEADENREKQIRAILMEVLPLMAKELSVEPLTKSVDAQNVRLGKLERSVDRLRHLRVGGMLLLMMLSFFAGGGAVIGIYWHDFKRGAQAARYLDFLRARGIETDARIEDGSIHFTVSGPRITEDATWQRNEKNEVTGINLIFPTP